MLFTSFINIECIYFVQSYGNAGDRQVLVTASVINPGMPSGVNTALIAQKMTLSQIIKADIWGCYNELIIQTNSI
jgi:hypothetical protein